MPRRSGRSVTESIVKQSGSPRFLGLITGTTAKSNTTTTTPFNASGLHLLGKILLLQADSDCYILATAGAGNESSVSSTNGVRIFANERVELCMDDPDNYEVANATEALWDLTMVPVSGTTNLKVWELL